MPRRETAPEPAPRMPERHETWEWSVRSIPSETHPNRNEDAVLVDSEHGVAGVFDGMGGHAYGQEASRAAAGSVRRSLAAWETVGDDDDATVMQQSLANALRSAHRRVIDEGDELYRERYLKIPEKDRKVYRPPQTTAVLAMTHRFADDRILVAVAYAGDSRAWRVGTDGTLELLTADHDYLSDTGHRHVLEELYGVALTEGAVARYREQLDEALDESQMTDELGKFLFRNRNIVATSLGVRHDPFRVDTAVHELHHGDIVLLTTDGIHDNLTRSRMRELAALAHSPEELVEILTREAGTVAASALRSGKKRDTEVRIHPDDMTAVASLCP